MSSAKIALVTTQSPAGPPSGAHIRLEAIISAIERVGDLQLVHVHNSYANTSPPALGDDSAVIHEIHLPRMDRLGYLRWLISGRTPPSLVGVADRRLPELLQRHPPDLVVCRPTGAFAMVCLPRDVPVVVDVDDLEGLKDAQVRQHRNATNQGLTQLPRRLFDRFAGWRVRTSWNRYYQSLRARGYTLVTCSPEDARYLGESVWAPNGFEIPDHPIGDPATDRDRPTFVFIGRLHYPPNRMAVDELVSEIWPVVRTTLPNAQLVVVGSGREQWVRRDLDPSISFTGQLESLEPILQTATATIMPIRSGGGTRLKVLEAFAHRIPVIATDIAVAGLGVRDDVHFARAGTIQEFAEQSASIADDPSRRVRLTKCAQDLVIENYSSEASISAFEGIFRSALARDPSD